LPNSVTLIGVTGMNIDDTLLVHGHTMPSALMSGAKKIILGHLHPTLLKQESILDGQKVWVFLRVQKEVIFTGARGMIDLIFMPSYNRSFIKHRKVSDQTVSVPMLRRIIKRDAVLECLILSMDGSLIGNEDLLFSLL
jgi:metallophosphoesterase superfamily enzyme